MNDDVLERLSRRSTVRRAIAFAGISLVIVLTVAARAVTEPAPRSAMGATTLAQPVTPASGEPAASTPASPAQSSTSSPPVVAAAPRTATHSTPAARTTTHPKPTTTPPPRQTTKAATGQAPTSRPTTAPPTTARPAPTTTRPAPPTTTRPPAPTTRTVTGAAYDVGYGVVQVRVRFQGHQILDVTAVSLPQGGRSSDVSAMSAPVLRREALASQSANINAVSGATYTSAGYAKSLQSAIDRAGG